MTSFILTHNLHGHFEPFVQEFQNFSHQNKLIFNPIFHNLFEVPSHGGVFNIYVNIHIQYLCSMKGSSLKSS